MSSSVSQSSQQQDMKQTDMKEKEMKDKDMKEMKEKEMKKTDMKEMKEKEMKKKDMKEPAMKQDMQKDMTKQEKGKEDQSGQFVDSLQKQLHHLENKFSKQMSKLREKLFQGPKEKMKVEPKKKSEIKPLNYSVKYSSESSYKDGKRDIKEHIEMKHPEMNVVADRVPGGDEFEVKIQKQGEQQPILKKLPSREIKKEIERVYDEFQNKTRDDFMRLEMPFSMTCGSLFGSDDLPMLESCSESCSKKEKESMKEEKMPMKEEKEPMKEKESMKEEKEPMKEEKEPMKEKESKMEDKGLKKEDKEYKKEDKMSKKEDKMSKKEDKSKMLAKRSAGEDFFSHEMRNIDREMEYMMKRMENEMSRFFEF